MIAVVYPSALEFWKHTSYVSSDYVTNNKLFKTQRNVVGQDEIIKELRGLAYQIPYPIYAEIPENSKRWTNSCFVCYRHRRNFPKQSFIQLTENVCISSPECCLLQAALHCSFEELVLVANELCSSYYLNEWSAFGQDLRTPVTNVAKIKTYLSRADKVYGIKKARSAIRYALDNSFSPYESRIAVAGLLPVFRGGFALETPSLNYNIYLSKDAANFMHREFVCGDVVWKMQKVVLEYDSNMTHLDKSQHYYDKKKATALMHSGYKVISATAEHFANFSNYEALFFMIRKELGQRTRRYQFEKFREQRYHVYKTLFRSHNG